MIYQCVGQFQMLFKFQTNWLAVSIISMLLVQSDTCTYVLWHENYMDGWSVLLYEKYFIRRVDHPSNEKSISSHREHATMCCLVRFPNPLLVEVGSSSSGLGQWGCLSHKQKGARAPSVGLWSWSNLPSHHWYYSNWNGLGSLTMYFLKPGEYPARRAACLDSAKLFGVKSLRLQHW